MKPLKLTMQAFGSYGEKTEIDFTKPNQTLFLVTGDTGAGKTTIFDAIVFALYGEASSESNKKEGAELQSQFAERGVSPFVELVFAEQDGVYENTYTVTRSPRHVRPLKRGVGVTEEKEKVSLILPDGSEYTGGQKETDGRIIEIIGLTKSQFMQIAMIAQGEFMELLRAKTSDRKLIFRKLFQTETYQKIVDELAGRRKDLMTDFARIRTQCQTETGKTEIPEMWDKAGELKERKDRIALSDQWTIDDLNEFLSLLEEMCVWTDERSKSLEEECERKKSVCDRRRKEWNRAGQIRQSYASMEQAEQVLRDCKEAEERIRQTEVMADQIERSYEIGHLYSRLCDAREERSSMASLLSSEKEKLPVLTAQAEGTAQIETKAKIRLENIRETFTKTEKNVEQSIALLRQIRQKEEVIRKKSAEMERAKAASVEAKQKLEDMDEWEKKAREKLESLSEVRASQERWKTQRQELENLEQEYAEAEQVRRSLEAQRRAAEQAQTRYAQAREAFSEKNREYIEKQNYFLDMQAGYLAKEKLKEGEPCPVCGSLDHPSPCVLSEEHGELTREVIDRLAAEMTHLRQTQEECAKEAGSASESVKEKEEDYKRRMERFAGKAEDMSAFLRDRRASLTSEGRRLEEEGERLEKIRLALESLEARRDRQRQQSEQADAAYVELHTFLAAEQGSLEQMTRQSVYHSEQEAREVLAKAKQEKEQAEATYESAHRSAKRDSIAREHIVSLITQHEKELPKREETVEERLRDYERILSEKSMTEQQWKELTSRYERDSTEAMRKAVQEHQEKKASALAVIETARAVIQDAKKPDMEQIQSALLQAEEELKNAQESRSQCAYEARTNRLVLEALRKGQKSRQEVGRRYDRTDSLYRRLGGRETGARMDIETFVQRYYLQRILYAANARFTAMTAGQYELRMVKEEEAGEGRNRGLDLMVYSHVTGQEREIRTLSGGESFMAALSLALGMADQIQSSCASIHLDMMFIDEGFGSLDDHARGQAVRVLQQMAGGEKLIGIISHVTELKQEIEDQLIVRKDEKGSHISWQIS